MTAVPPAAAVLVGLLLVWPAPWSGAAAEEGWPALAAMPQRPAAMASAEEMARLAERLAVLGDEARRRAAQFRAGDDDSGGTDSDDER